MYAVIETGGKQYRVQPGEVIEIEKLAGDVGTKTKFDQVLFCASSDAASTKIWMGKPTLAGATVEGEVVGQGRGEKVLIVKMKRRKQYRKTQGHRQELTHVLVTGVSNGSGETATLSSEDRKATLAKFQSHLTPKGGKVKAAAKADASTEKKASAKSAATTEKKPAAKKRTAKTTA
jgi:large subunit ribosomal protein L21